MEKNTINNENIQKNEILIPKRVLFDEKNIKNDRNDDSCLQR